MAPWSLSKTSYLHALACAIPDTWHFLRTPPHLYRSQFYYSFVIDTFVFPQQMLNTCQLCAQLWTRYFHINYQSSCQPCKGRSVICILRRKSLDSERLSRLPETTHLASGRAGIRHRPASLWSPAFYSLPCMYRGTESESRSIRGKHSSVPG